MNQPAQAPPGSPASGGPFSHGDSPENQSLRDRLQRRRRLLRWSLLPVLLMLCLAAKLLSVGVFAGTASSAFEAGNSGALADAAAGLRIANFTEPHKAPFATGDGLFLAGDYAGARRSFEEALQLAGQADGCLVRVNLALSIERLGDAKAMAGDPAAAARLFAEGLAVVEGAPAGCFDSSGGGSAGAAADKLKQAGERLTRKGEEAAGASAPEPGTQSGEPAQPAEPGNQSRLDQLNESSRQAQSQRNSGQERDEYLRDDDFGSGAERPW